MAPLPPRFLADLNSLFGGPVGLRGLGYLYQPKYRDKKTKEQRTSSVWWWDPPGGLPRVSTGCRDKRDAEAWRIQRLAELGKGSTIGLKARRLTFEDLVKMIRDDYLAKGLKSYPDLKSRLKPLVKAFAGRLATEVGDEAVRAYVAKRREEGAAVATINMELKHLGRMYNLAKKKIPEELRPTIKLLPGEHVRMDVLDDASLRLILEKLKPKYQAVIEGLWETGWREMDILGLDWPRVSFEDQSIRVDETKEGEPGYLSFAAHPKLRAILLKQLSVREALEIQGIISPWVFPHENGDRISQAALQQAWRHARSESGVVASEGPFIHGLRRKMAKELLDAGVSEPDAMKITRHKTADTFRRYACRDRAAQDRALALREAYRVNLPTVQKVESLHKA